MICFVFLICSLRTNIVFFTIFFTLVCAFGCLAGAYFNLALVYENPENTIAAAKAAKLVVVSSSPISYMEGPLLTLIVKAGGAFTFVTSLAGWWIFVAIMLASLDFPISLPVGDLSHIIKGRSQKKTVAAPEV